MLILCLQFECRNRQSNEIGDMVVTRSNPFTPLWHFESCKKTTIQTLWSTRNHIGQFNFILRINLVCKNFFERIIDSPDIQAAEKKRKNINYIF